MSDLQAPPNINEVEEKLNFDEVQAQLANQLKDFQNFSHHLGQGGSLGAWLGVDPNDLEAAYAMGCHFYERGEYDTALRIYAMVMMANVYDKRFAVAMGMCHQMLKQYDDAIGYYGMALALDFDDPLPSFHMGECLVFSGKRNEALDALGICLKRANPRLHADIYQRACDLHNLLEASAGSTTQPGAQA